MTNTKGSNIHPVDWIVHVKDLDMKESIGKGSMGDYQRANLKSKDVCSVYFLSSNINIKYSQGRGQNICEPKIERRRFVTLGERQC